MPKAAKLTLEKTKLMKQVLFQGGHQTPQHA
jgi:hypothetical protein